MAGQSGYTVHFGEAQQAAEQLGLILEEFATEIKNIESVKEDLLSDANWKGPNKDQFTAEFAEYEAAISGLYQNGVEHLEALQQILNSYADAEQ